VGMISYLDQCDMKKEIHIKTENLFLITIVIFYILTHPTDFFQGIYKI
jgi:hypothetical protein